MMTKMQKITLLLAFWTAPWGAAKGATWEFFVDDKMPFEEESILLIFSRIINGVDEKYVDWSAMEGFFDITMAMIEEASDVVSEPAVLD